MENHFQYCADYLRCHDYGKYIASLYLQEETRKAAFTVHAFDYELKQIAYRISDPMLGEIRIQWWRDAIVTGNDCAGSPVAQALQSIIAKYNFPLETIEKLINAHLFDLYQDPMVDKAAFESYLKDVSSPLLRLLAAVVSGAGENSINNNNDSYIEMACDHAGIFIGIVELLKALPSHTRLQCFYFPEDLSTHRQIPEHLPVNQSKKIDSTWIKDIVEYASTHYDSAANAISRLTFPVQKIFYGCALAKMELEDIVKKGIDTDFSYRGLLPLKIHWFLWKINRSSGAFNPGVSNNDSIRS